MNQVRSLLRPARCGWSDEVTSLLIRSSWSLHYGQITLSTSKPKEEAKQQLVHKLYKIHSQLPLLEYYLNVYMSTAAYASPTWLLLRLLCLPLLFFPTAIPHILLLHKLMLHQPLLLLLLLLLLFILVLQLLDGGLSWMLRKKISKYVWLYPIHPVRLHNVPVQRIIPTTSSIVLHSKRLFHCDLSK